MTKEPTAATQLQLDQDQVDNNWSMKSAIVQYFGDTVYSRGPRESDVVAGGTDVRPFTYTYSWQKHERD